MNKKILVFIVLLIFLANFSFSKSNRVKIKRAKEKIYIDGNLTERDWKEVTPVGKFFVFPTHNFEKKDRTEAKMLWDDENIYIAFKSYDKHIEATRTQRLTDVYNDDCVEFFVSPFKNKTKVYINIEINALGSYNSGIHLLKPNPMLKTLFGVKNPEKTSTYWFPPGLQIGRYHVGTMNKNDDEDSYWIIEISVPFSLFKYAGYNKKKPEIGDVWRFNLYRLGGTIDSFRRNLFFLPPKKSNHATEYFGYLIFDK